MDTLSREQRIQTICQLILATVAVGFVLYWLRAVMIPFVLAAFLAIGIAPLIDLQVHHLRIPRGLAILATLTLVVGLLNVLTGLISTSVAQLAGSADLYQERVQSLIARMAVALKLGKLPYSGWESLSQQSVERISGLLVGTTNALLGILSQGLLVMIFLIFLLLGGSGGEKQRGEVWSEVEVQIRRYLLTKTLISAVTGGLVGVVLTVLGIDLALVFGLFAFLLNFIPSIGSVIATLLPLPIVMMNPSVSPTVAILAIAVQRRFSS